MKRFTDRFLPNRLRRPTSKKPRGANSNRSSASPLTSERPDAPSIPPPYANRSASASSTARDVAPRLAGVRHLFNADAAEEAECAEPQPALDEVGIAQRLPRLDQQLALDGLGLGAGVADDDHPVDDRLRAFLDRVADVGPRVVLGPRDLGTHSDLVVAAVAVREVDAVAVGDHLALREGAARRQLDDGAYGVLGHGLRPLEDNSAHRGLRTFGHAHGEVDTPVVAARRRRWGDRLERLHFDERVNPRAR